MDSSGSGRKSLGSDVFDFKHEVNILVNSESQGPRGKALTPLSVPSAFSVRRTLGVSYMLWMALSQTFPLRENGNESVPYLRGIL